MLFGVVRGPSFEEAKRQVEKALPFADGVEWRFDLFSFSDVTELLGLWPKLSLFTFRGASKEQIWKLLALEPDFFDIDIREDYSWLEEARRRFPKTRYILSYHDETGMPDDLEGLFARMKKTPAFAYKIAARTHCSLDALKMLCFVQAQKQVIGIAMGEEGQFARALGPIVGNLIDYAALGEPLAGQLGIEELCHTYGYPRHQKEDPVYALLGDPVSHSQGHVWHNQTLKKGVYVKIKLVPEELEAFKRMASGLPFAGLSVTMPLKKCFGKEAINTIAVRKGKWHFTNTDGQAALNLLEQHTDVRGRSCVILGAGGAAEGIARALAARGARITLANRTKATAEALAQQIGAEVATLDRLPHYEILVQATSVGMAPNVEEMPIREEQILQGSIVLEAIAKPSETRFLEAARKRGCRIIDGQALWREQALLQQKFWKN